MEQLIHTRLLCAGVFSACLLISISQPARAQAPAPDPPRDLPIGETRLPEALPSVSFVVDVTATLPKPKAVDRKFTVLGAALVAAMATDTYSTFKSVDWCPRCHEANPYVAPFVKRGPSVTYPAGLGFDAGVLVLSAAMRKSDNIALRRVWWLPAAALIAGHSMAIRNNFNLRVSCRGDARCGPVQ